VDATNGFAIADEDFSPMVILPSILAQLSASISVSFSEFTRERGRLEVIGAINETEIGGEKDPPIEISSTSMFTLTGEDGDGPSKFRGGSSGEFLEVTALDVRQGLTGFLAVVLGGCFLSLGAKLTSVPSISSSAPCFSTC
jgi:hypothetical protein